MSKKLTDDEPAVQVGAKRLRPAAYENNLEVSRRWKREHPDEADRHNWTTCACGNRMSRHAEECSTCQVAARDERDALILELREQGQTARQIAAALDTTTPAVRSAAYRARKRKGLAI